MNEIKVIKLDRPIQCGDWHDKPLRWEVASENQANIQRFSNRKHAELFARFWRNADFIGAMNQYAALPVDYDFNRGYRSQL